MNLTLINIIELLGTFAFAVSGLRIAAGKQIDWFGAYIIGLVTAIGGGTLRDLLLNQTPFWMTDGKYVLITGIALIATIIFKQKIFKLGSTLFLFDTIGLGLFTIVGISKSLDAGFPYWTCIIMGAITGSVGGVIRDILLNEVPMLFQKDIYALACIAGGSIYFLFQFLNFPHEASEIAGAITVILVRIVSVKYNLNLPKFQKRERLK